MQKSDEELTGERLNFLLMTSGPGVAACALHEKFNESTVRKISKYLRKKNCHNPAEHSKSVMSSTWIDVLKEFTKCFSGLKEACYRNPSGWLISVGINCSNKHLSEDIEKDRLIISLSSDEEIFDEKEFDYLVNKNNNFNAYHQIKENSPEADVQRKESLEHIVAHIQKFPQIQQATLILHVNGYTYKEIGEILHLHENYAKKIVSKIARSIKQENKRMNGGLR